MENSNPAEATRQQVEEQIVKWRELRSERLAAEKVAASIKKDEDLAKSFVLEAFKQQRFEGMLIDGRITGLSEKEAPSVVDKEALIAHIRATGELELLQFQISTTAVRERWEAETEVPGVGSVKTYDLFDRSV